MLLLEALFADTFRPFGVVRELRQELQNWGL